MNVMEQSLTAIVTLHFCQVTLLAFVITNPHRNSNAVNN